jgi:hypothetical protein
MRRAVLRAAYGIADPDAPAGEYYYKDPFTGHDAVTSLMVNGAPIVAFLPDLRNLHKNIGPQAQTSAYGQGREIDALSGNVFREVPRPYVKALLDHLVDALSGKEAYLTVPGSGMGILYDSMIGAQNSGGHIVLPDPFLIAY